jgi:hypothetical protein
MRIKQILETTTAGSVATVAMPMMTQTRENTNVKGLKPVDQMKKGTKKKSPYANSITESKVKELTMDLTQLNNDEFQKKYKKTKAEIRVSMKNVNEDDLAEQDLIVIPGQGRLRKTGFVKHDLDQGEHEGHTLKNSLHTIARAASDLDKRLSVQSEFPEWVSEKIGAAKGMMVTVMDYLISSQEMQHDTDAMEGSDRQWSKKDMEKLRVATRDFDDIMASDGPEAFKQELIKKRIQTKPMAGPKGVLPEGSQRVDSLVTDALRVMKGPEISDAVLALKRVLGDRAYNERRGFYSFYVDQIHDMYGQQDLSEEWSEKYKSSINCSHPKGFSQKAHCAGKKKHNESVEMEMVCEDCGMCQTHGNLNEIKKGEKDSNGYTRCWPGKHAEGTKKSAVTGKQVRNCVPNESITEDLDADQQFDLIEDMVMELAEAHGVDADQIWEDFESVDDHELFETAAWRRSAGKSKKGGLNAKGVASYRRENPGSKLQMAVTTKPSKLNAGSKAAKRRKSFCARMGGVKGPMKKPNGKPTRKALALRKWNC